MKKQRLFLLLVLLALLPAFTLPCAAAETDELASQTADTLEALLDPETKEALQAFGVETLRPDAMFDVSLENITAFFAQSLGDHLRALGRSFFSFLSLLLLLAVARALVQGEKAAAGVQLLCGCAAVLFAAAQLQGLMNAVLSAMQVGLDFMLGYIPVYAGILALSGGPVSASFYSSFVFAFAQVLSAFCNGGCVALLGCYFALLIAVSFSSSLSVARFVGGVNRAMSVLLGFAATSFAAVLGVRGVLASSMDAVSAKSVRFLLSSLIPVVGSAISEAYSAVLGSIHLIKGSVAVVGILVLLVLSVPAILQAAALQLCFLLLAAAAELLDCGDLAALLRGFGVGVRFLVLLAVFELFVLLITTGVMLSVKGGG